MIVIKTSNLVIKALILALKVYRYKLIIVWEEIFLSLCESVTWLVCNSIVIHAILLSKKGFKRDHYILCFTLNYHCKWYRKQMLLTNSVTGTKHLRWYNHFYLQKYKWLLIKLHQQLYKSLRRFLNKSFLRETKVT